MREMKRNVSVVRLIPISGKIINEIPGSVASGPHCTIIRLLKEHSFISYLCEMFRPSSNAIKYIIAKLPFTKFYNL